MLKGLSMPRDTDYQLTISKEIHDALSEWCEKQGFSYGTSWDAILCVLLDKAEGNFKAVA